MKNVEETSKTLQNLFDWTSEHGGSHFDDLVDRKGRSVLWLHDFNSDHHPRFKEVELKARGIGVSIYVLVKNIDETSAKSQKLDLKIVEELHMNENARFREFTLQIEDGYFFTVCEKSDWLKI